MRPNLQLNQTGIIYGISVTAKETVEYVDRSSPCEKCAFVRHICCDVKSAKRNPNRPACFANDPENLSKKSLYFEKLCQNKKY